MRETICTIPINDVFAPKDGCPICRMRDMLEKNYVEYITGAAMMEPDVRIETNEKGFCHHHFEMMVQNGKRLQNALILESHLEKIINDYFPEKAKSKPDKKSLAGLASMEESCFVCDKIAWGMRHMFESIFKSYETDAEFKKLFNEQEYICLPHYRELMTQAISKNGIASKHLSDFNADASLLVRRYLTELKADVSHFCAMFDYRNRGGDWGNSRDSVERAVAFLSSRKINAEE